MVTPTTRLDGPFAALRRCGFSPQALLWDIATLPFQISNTLAGVPDLTIPTTIPGCEEEPPPAGQVTNLIAVFAEGPLPVVKLVGDAFFVTVSFDYQGPATDLWLQVELTTPGGGVRLLPSGGYRMGMPNASTPLSFTFGPVRLGSFPLNGATPGEVYQASALVASDSAGTNVLAFTDPVDAYMLGGTTRVSILAPAEGASYPVGTLVTFRATAFVDGIDLSAQIDWYLREPPNFDGLLWQENTATTAIAPSEPGRWTFEASVTDPVTGALVTATRTIIAKALPEPVVTNLTATYT